MKKLFGKILVGAIGCVMALGINAFAANEIKDITITPDKETGKVTISGTITGDAASPESTILVAPENVSLIDVTDANIKYIDQETVAAGAFKYEFTLAKGVKYNVWFGGTDITAPESGIIDLTAEAETPGGKFKIVGTVTVAVGASYSDVTVKADDVDGTVADGGAYTIEVAPGTYAVVLGKPGYLYKTYADVKVADKDVDLGALALLAGELNGDDVINIDDVTTLLANYQKDEFASDCDLNDDGVVNIDDVTTLLASYQKSYE